MYAGGLRGSPRPRANARESHGPRRVVPHHGAHGANARDAFTHGTRLGETPSTRHIVAILCSTRFALKSPKASWAHRAGLPSEPSRGFSWNFPLLAKPAILSAQSPQLLALGARRTVLATPFIALRLTHPVGAACAEHSSSLGVQPARTKATHTPSGAGTPARKGDVSLPSGHLLRTNGQGPTKAGV